MERPDLGQVDPAVRAYIEALESQLEQLKPAGGGPPEPAPEPAEPPTTLNVITASAGGLAKRTPRHLYSRQHRGGMGVFDLETPDGDQPAFLTIADESQDVLLITNLARCFRTPVKDLPETPVRGRGASLTARLPLREEERLAAILPAQDSGYVALASQSGMVRCLRYHYFGDKLDPDIPLYNFKIFGPLAAAGWTPGDADLFIATRLGLAIRFSEKQVSVQGSPGIRLEKDDTVVGVAAVRQNGGVFMISADGRGTLRLMSGFSPNKSPGGGGKAAMKTDSLVGLCAVSEGDDLFILSRLSKLIRFKADEVPPKEGLVQGVNCMALRADEVTAVWASGG